MKDQLCTRQICFILIAFSAAGKLLMLPAQLAYFAKNDLWVCALILYLLQIAAVWSAAFLCSKSNGTFFNLLQNTFGTAVSKVFMWLFAIFFVMAAFIPICEQKLFVHEIFYDTVPALIVFIPFFFLSTYMGGKGLNNAGRAADIAFPLFIASFAAIFIMSVTQSNAGWLLPVFSNPVKDIARGVHSTLYAFTDGAVMLMFMGRFKYKKGDCTKITLSYAAGAAIVIAFILTFYSVFSALSPDEYFAISKTAIFFPALSVTGRLDLIAVYVTEIAMLCGIILYIQLAAECVYTAINKRAGRQWISLAINVILLVLIIIFNDKYRAVQGVYGNILWYVFAVFTLLLPCLAWVLKRSGKR
ncbi:MAG: spore germination protein [Clostridia bacterium]|nr:spore germination protein [Clostridia bacterium]